MQIDSLILDEVKKIIAEDYLDECMSIQLHVFFKYKDFKSWWSAAGEHYEGYYPKRSKNLKRVFYRTIDSSDYIEVKFIYSRIDELSEVNFKLSKIDFDVTEEWVAARIPDTAYLYEEELTFDPYMEDSIRAYNDIRFGMFKYDKKVYYHTRLEFTHW